MKKGIEKMETEPIRLVNILMAIVVIVIDALVTYLRDLDAKSAAIVGLLAVSALLSSGEIGRRKVVSPDTLERVSGKTISEIS
jgi:hypothetical protein